MHLSKALDIAEGCALETVGEAIYDVNRRAGQIFSHYDINKELEQLYTEWNTIKSNSSFTVGSSITEVMDYMKDAEIAFD